MSDDIFNYFSNQGTRKVEPIDDAEFDSIDAPSAAPMPPSEEPPRDGESSENLPLLETVEPSPALEITQTAPTAAPTVKEQSHWDVLASFLGIKKSTPATPAPAAPPRSATPAAKPTPPATELPAKELPAKEVPAKEVPVDRAPATPARSQAIEPTRQSTKAEKPAKPSFFDLEPIETAKEAAILNDLFRAADPVASHDAQVPVDDDDQEIESELEYLEFEIEDLDSTGLNQDDSERRLRRNFEDEGVSRDRPARSSGRRDGRPNDRGREGGREVAQDRGRHGGRESTNDRGRDGSREVARDGSREVAREGSREVAREGSREVAREGGRSAGHAQRPDSTSPRQDSRGGEHRERKRNEGRGGPSSDRNPREPRRHPIASESETAYPDEVRERPDFVENARESDEVKRKRRRRRRGRGRTDELEGASIEGGAEATSGLPRNKTAPEYDPPDEFFDEIGWEPAASSESARGAHPSRRDNARIDSRVDEEDDDLELDFESPSREIENDDEESKPAGEGERKRRRRRRGKKSDDRVDRPPIVHEDDLDVGDDDDGDPYANYDDDDDDFERPPRQGRKQGSDSASSKSSSHADDDLQDRKKKFPTWAEAISVLVDSNIKNHSRSPGHGGRSPRRDGGGGGGRRRR